MIGSLNTNSVPEVVKQNISGAPLALRSRSPFPSRIGPEEIPVAVVKIAGAVPRRSYSVELFRVAASQGIDIISSSPYASKIEVDLVHGVSERGHR
jgi:hypothetical protein